MVPKIKCMAFVDFEQYKYLWYEQMFPNYTGSLAKKYFNSKTFFNFHATNEKQLN